MVTTAARASCRTTWVRAVDEFVLTTILLFLAVTVVRWLRTPGSALYIADLDVALAVIGGVSGAILTGLILTPPGRRSGGHMNPAVTVTLWLMDSFHGRRVVPYVSAQLAGSAAGTGLARLVWGRRVSLPAVAFGAVRPAPTWAPALVFLAEAGCMIVMVLVVGLLARPARTILLPYAIGVYVAVVIAVFGPRSGGSINPARQFGPAAFSGRTTDLWIYLVAPVLGAVLGVSLLHLLIERLRAYATPAATDDRSEPRRAIAGPARRTHELPLPRPDDPEHRGRPLARK